MQCFYHVEMLWMVPCGSFSWELCGVQTTCVRVEESACGAWDAGRGHRGWLAPSPGDGPAKVNKSPQWPRTNA